MPLIGNPAASGDDYHEVMRRRRAVWMARGFGALVTVLAAVVGPAAAASAHSQLVAADPAPGAQLASPPDHVTLRFNEPVDINLGAIRVFDNNGRQLGASTAHHPGGNSTEVEVTLPRLASGAYVVAWRVVSADSHPVHAAYTFTVGAGGTTVAPGLIDRLLASDRSDRAVGVLLALTRFLVFFGVAVGVGGLVFLTAVWPRGRDRTDTGRILAIAGLVGLAASVAMMGLQAPYVTGRSLGAVFEASGWRAVLSTRSGHWWLARSVALAVAVGFVLARRRLGELIWRLAVLIIGLFLFVAMAYSGHGAYGRNAVLGLLDTVVHLAAISTWIGGLVLLAVVLRRGEADERSPVARRFSSIALGAVALVVVSGSVEGWRQIGSFDALFHTNYGQLLLVKLGLVAVVLAVAVFSRRATRRGARMDAGGLRRKVLAEQAVAVAVLVVTSLLVNTAPALGQSTGPFSTTLVSGNHTASITIAPARVGRNVMHVYLFDAAGSILPASKISAQLSLPARDIGPLDQPLNAAGPNHAIGTALQFPFPGAWRLNVIALYGFDQVTFTTTVRVR